ncbi:hypothetical protein KP509_24G045400 [Ceratopteris richardii]|uniref:MD-2-related lipid-recognition domain-containing protein n=1 Tax=Ceratopteris richardii TaxID=49495 RepID=A0A8T2RW67_CERRI|nr:hypothetical protein KP509_24G045400 [Ceratopteris richardii]KAH7300122.1 hypothetical protein KP509_24G045400 [Ceratopteris richardii]
MGRCLQLVFSLIIIFSPFASAKYSWRPCSSTEEYQVTVNDVKVNPDPIKRGGNATFEIPAVASETIIGGTIKVQVYYLGLNVHEEMEDLCVRTNCPIPPGQFSLINSESLPSYAPTGSYRLQMRVENELGHLLTCLSINFQISSMQSELL